MATLLLRLAAPLQSWGDESKFETRRTRREPTKSGVVGLLAAALGIRRNETDALHRLNKLRFGVRTDKEGQLIVDYHTAKNEEKKNAAYITYRHYLSDAVFLAGLESQDETLLLEIQEALRHPCFPLFLGRRSCPPTLPLCLGIRRLDLLAALKAEPGQGGDKNRGTRIVADVQFDSKDAALQRDVPISFSPLHRQYGYRAVGLFHIKTEPEDVQIDETTHDPFQELEGT